MIKHFHSKKNYTTYYALFRKSAGFKTCAFAKQGEYSFHNCLINKYFHLIIILFFVLSNHLNAQIEIQATDQPLGKVLLALKNEHDLQLSYNDQLLSDCTITLSGNYTTPEQALKKLLSPCDLSYKKIGEVFVISAKVPAIMPPLSYSFQGRIIDKNSGEALPFSSLQIHTSGLTSDINGAFSFRTKDSLLRVQVLHLGYYPLDTIYLATAKPTIALTPGVVGLQEVLVKAGISLSPTLPTKAGLVKVNHKISRFLPGNNDNSIFNLLRLQPGVLAAGEQTKDFFIWGSYKGQTQLIFDGMTLFNTSSLNDDIGAVNPLLVKDIEVHKGGYNVHVGDRVGGVVNVTGKTGRKDAVHADLHLNNQTANGLLNVPLSGNMAMQMACRKTYYELFSSEKDTLNSNFTDLNWKLSGNTKTGDTYFFSLLGSQDINQEFIEEAAGERKYYFSTNTNIRQLGGAFFYGKKWKKGSFTNLRCAYSNLLSSFDNNAKIQDINSPNEYESNDNFTTNDVSEAAIKLDHFFIANKQHSLSAGGAIIRNTSAFQDSFKTNVKALIRFETYIKDDIRLSPALSLEPGIRLTLPFNNLTPSLQPRLRANFKANEQLNAHIAYGLYHQYIAENAIIDNNKNALYFWSIDNKLNKKTLSGTHWVVGVTYQHSLFEWKAETYYKTAHNISRFLTDNLSGITTASSGNSRTYGLDISAKTRIKKHDFWLAYTLSNTEEQFDYFSNKAWQPAPQDQRHEFKCAGMFNFSPFYLSMNYVYGSGFPNSIESVEKIPVYSRLDLAALYKFKPKKINMETGVSVLNILNHYNVKYNNFSNFPDNKTIYAPATPFTPTVFLHIGF